MGKPTLARVSVVRGELAMLIFADATRDGEIDHSEQRAIGDALGDWFATARAAQAAQALGDALERGILDERYRLRLVDECFTEIDELPPLEAA